VILKTCVTFISVTLCVRLKHVFADIVNSAEKVIRHHITQEMFLRTSVAGSFHSDFF